MGYTVLRPDELEFDSPSGGDARRGIVRLYDSLRHARANIWRYPPGTRGRPHRETVQEEIFVVLEGDGTLELTPSPNRRGAQEERHDVRRGHVVSRPAGTRVAHAFRAGAQGLTLLAYGTRDANDIAYYPRSRKLFFRGAGVIARVEHVDYWEGED